MYTGLRHMKEKKNIINTNTLVSVVQTIKDNNAGIRTQPGTNLKSSITGEVIYTPPCCENEIRQKLGELEVFINETKEDHLDPLVKLALIHYQFEAIHPFVDGNGRTGRILNNLFLVQQNLLPHPVLYLSHYIAEHKQDYYQLLRRVTEQQQWTDWILFILTAIGHTAQLTTKKIRTLLELRTKTEERMKKTLQASYSQDLLDLLFIQPYLKIETLVKKELAHRQTASVWLKKLTEEGILEPQKKGRVVYYVHQSLMNILSNRN
jgi:Fic family protein